MTPKPDDACPSCERELWLHTRAEAAECRAKAGGFAILCGRGRARIVPLQDLEAELGHEIGEPPDSAAASLLEPRLERWGRREGAGEDLASPSPIADVKAQPDQDG